MVLAALAVVRTVFIPPVPGARFIGYDGPVAAGSCNNRPSAKGGQVLVCNGSFHIDSRFAVVNHASAAAAWCIQRIDEAHFNTQPAPQFGPLTVGVYPPVPVDWGGCTQMLPMRTGLYAQIIVRH